jgi:hypothetical protein
MTALADICKLLPRDGSIPPIAQGPAEPARAYGRAYEQGRVQYRAARSSSLREAARTCSTASAPPCSQNFSLPFTRQRMHGR